MLASQLLLFVSFFAVFVCFIRFPVALGIDGFDDGLVFGFSYLVWRFRLACGSLIYMIILGISLYPNFGASFRL